MMTKTERDELRKKWETRIADFKKSGQTAAQYCKDNGLKPAQLGYWLRKFRTENKVTTGTVLVVDSSY
jgi:transposase-like protein